MPVMEGKALLFRHFAGIDSVPITLDVHTADEIVETVKAIAPSFGAINLEDIAAQSVSKSKGGSKPSSTFQCFTTTSTVRQL